MNINQYWKEQEDRKRQAQRKQEILLWSNAKSLISDIEDILDSYYDIGLEMFDNATNAGNSFDSTARVRVRFDEESTPGMEKVSIGYTYSYMEESISGCGSMDYMEGEESLYTMLYPKSFIAPIEPLMQILNISFRTGSKHKKRRCMYVDFVRKVRPVQTTYFELHLKELNVGDKYVLKRLSHDTYELDCYGDYYRYSDIREAATMYKLNKYSVYRNALGDFIFVREIKDSDDSEFCIDYGNLDDFN